MAAASFDESLVNLRPFSLSFSLAADLDAVAHYVMQRFGESEEDDGAAQQRGSRDGGGARGAQPSLTASPQHPGPQVQGGDGDFLIAALREEGSGDSRGSPGPSPTVLSPAELFGCSEEGSNGRRLVHAMQCEVEERGAAHAGHSLVAAQDGLASAQQRLLDCQRALIAQQAAVLQAVGTAATTIAAGSGSGMDTGWSAAAVELPLASGSSYASFRQRAVARSDSGRALPAGRPAVLQARSLSGRLGLAQLHQSDSLEHVLMPRGVP